HTIVHEFGHVIQVLMGAREAGSAHSPEFYRILDKAHQNGHADRIRERLNQACLARGIDLSAIVYSPEAAQSQPNLSMLTMQDIQVGQQLYVHAPAYREHNPLMVMKKNRKAVSLRSLTTGYVMRASPQALHREAP